MAQRKRLTGSHAARPPSNQGLKVAAAVIAPLLVAAALIALVASFNDDDGGSSESDSSTTTATASKDAQAFQTKVDEAFKPLGEAIKVFLPKAQEYESGKVTPADFKAAIDAALPEFVKARDAVAALGKYKKKPAINGYFLDAADLYVETARIYNIAVDPAADALRPQLNVAARRAPDPRRPDLRPGSRRHRPVLLRRDDAGRRDPSADRGARLAAEGMAAGPPLAAEPGPAAAAPPVQGADLR